MQDYARVLGMVANDGVWQGVRILSAESVAIIKTRTQWDGGRQGAAFWSYRGGGSSPLIGHRYTAPPQKLMSRYGWHLPYISRYS